jgi:hypothetical protein
VPIITGAASSQSHRQRSPRHDACLHRQLWQLVHFLPDIDRPVGLRMVTKKTAHYSLHFRTTYKLKSRHFFL